ncbi:preprotein translocase subunit SecD [Sphingobacterium alkalisoli]|uniref:Preprotein translocase subunit SecD n=2 Tax=Sphingobacterium alkalisoli TaxID=1874115 RepID=A0A4U0H2I0_9SPHI|nr:preprotein translocase subunit SecD [Sphingobacterium alkalisoli]TJY65847.1 preprotein translocase subunit SecD [Sphingobacterium alkalisoli]
MKKGNIALHLKWVGILLFCCFMVNNIFAQTKTGEKKHVGRYGGNDGICLFEDGQFLLYGYATAVFGNYHVENDGIHFYPDRRDLFEVYGHYNPQLEAEHSRWNFVGFEEGNTFVRYDEDSIHRVFNEGANCFSGPFIKSWPHGATIVSLTERNNEELTFKTWHFENKDACNDFIAVYNEVREQHKDFRGALEGNILKLSNYGGDEGYTKREDDQEWDDILALKAEYASFRDFGDVILSNPHHRSFQRDISSYKLDISTNQYILSDTLGNEDYCRDSPYQDDRFLRKYDKIHVAKESTDEIESGKVALSSIIYTVCDEDAEDSYRYDSEFESE